MKDSKGEVVAEAHSRPLFSRDADQQQLGNFLEKMEVDLPPGKYTLESAVIDQESSKTGAQRSEFTVPASGRGGDLVAAADAIVYS